MSTPDESSMSIQPLHDPTMPLGNNNGQGLGTRALLSKRMATQRNNNKFVSPTDKMLTPVSQKLNAAKKKRFDKAKPMGNLFASQEPPTQDDDKVSDGEEPSPTQDVPETDTTPDAKMMVNDDESPF